MLDFAVDNARRETANALLGALLTKRQRARFRLLRQVPITESLLDSRKLKLLQQHVSYLRPKKETKMKLLDAVIGSLDSSGGEAELRPVVFKFAPANDEPVPAR